MRGCLTILVAGVAFLALLGWLVLQPLAGAIVTAGLVASGLSGTDTRVDVVASPPYELLDLRADSIVVTSSDVSWYGMTAASLDIRLTGIDLGARTATSVAGRLDGVSMTTSAGATPVHRVDLEGPSSAIRAVLSLDAATANRLAERAVEQALGGIAASVRLAAPDRVLVSAAGRQVEGQLAIDPQGALIVIVPSFGRAVVADLGSDVPFVVGGVTVTTGGGATLTALLDPTAVGLSR